MRSFRIQCLYGAEIERMLLMILEFTSRGWRGEIAVQVARLKLPKNEAERLDTILWDLFNMLSNIGTASYIDPEFWKSWLFRVTEGRLVIDAELWRLVMSEDDHLFAFPQESIVLPSTADAGAIAAELHRRGIPEFARPEVRKFITSVLGHRRVNTVFVVPEASWHGLRGCVGRWLVFDRIPYALHRRFDGVIVLLPFGRPWIAWELILGKSDRKACPYCTVVLVQVEFESFQTCGIGKCLHDAESEIIAKLGL